MKFNKTLLAIFNQQWLYPLAILFFGILIYSVILSIGIPGKLNQFLGASDVSWLFLVSILLLYFAFRPLGWLGILTSFCGTVSLFAFQLSALWRSGLSESAFVLGGVLAMTETSSYYGSALNLLEGGKFSTAASWRPLAHGVLATFLGLTQQNFQFALAILVFITAIACFFLAREVQSSQGTLAGVVVLVILFLFYRNYLGTASTETLGLTLGAVGLAMLWRGAIKVRMNPCLLGILLLTLALNARAGAFFVLPALLIWGAWVFRGSSRFSGRFLLGGVSMILLGFMVNSLVFKVVNPPHATAFSNFSYSLYGLIKGGTWQTVFVEHPELAINDPESGQKIYALVWEELRAHPFALIGGCLRAWWVFLFDDFIFSFSITSIKSPKVNITLQILSLVALIQCYRQRYTPIGSMLLMIGMGIFFSVPLLPPWDAGMRIYAATIPFFALLPALGITTIAKRSSEEIAQKLSWEKLLQVPEQQEQSSLLWIFGLSLALLTFGGPMATKILSHPPQFAEISCPVGSSVVYFRNSDGSSINLVADDEIRQSNLPNIRVSDFRKLLEKYRARYPNHPAISELTEELSQLNPHTTIINKIDIKNGNTVWIIADSHLIPQKKGIVGVCGQPSTNPMAKKPNGGYWRFPFYADSMTLVSREPQK